MRRGMLAAMAGSLRLVTWNVLGARGYPRETGIGMADWPHPPVVAGITGLLRGLDADAIALQEAPPAETVAGMAESLGCAHAWFSAGGKGSANYPWGFPGAILVRGTIAAARDLRATVPHPPGCFQRHWGEVEAGLRGTSLRLATTHLCVDWGGVVRETERQGEVAALGPARPGTVIAADWNAQPGSPTMQALDRAGWRNAWDAAPEVTAGTTVPRPPSRRVRLDGFRLGPGLAARGIRMLEPEEIRLGDAGWLSDHLPVVAELVPAA